MRKRLITPTPQDVQSRDESWIDLDRAAVVEVTSEAKDYPVESALVLVETRGWRAAIPGTQTIRLVFDQPQRLRHISLVFEETKQRVRRSSFCDGLRTAVARFEKSCASSGISAHLRHRACSLALMISGVPTHAPGYVGMTPFGLEIRPSRNTGKLSGEGGSFQWSVMESEPKVPFGFQFIVPVKDAVSALYRNYLA